jgi:hypothetical protein
MAEVEITKHYGGEATVKFYPGMHGYFVDDPAVGAKNKRTGGGTSLTGVMAKGQGLMMWPMWEMSKYLRTYFESTPLKDIIDDPDITIDTLLKAGRDAHVKKSDKGKSVGTDAHAWVESYSNALQESQEKGTKFVAPEVPEVEDIAKVLRKAYVRIINDLKPKELDEFKRLPKLIFKEIEIQEQIWNEATMVRQSILGAKEWLEMHDIKVHGAEGTVYSRELFVCGKYDADWEVTCTEKCRWCYQNGAPQPAANNSKTHTFTGRYITDFKSTNASSEQPKGIYPEYLAQCAVYEIGLLEEFPERKYDGYLILNGSKVPAVNKKTGEEFPLFNTHFSFNNQAHREWARNLAKLKEQIFVANNEMKGSNAGIKVPEKTAAK